MAQAVESDREKTLKWCDYTLAIWRLRPGGKMPPAAAAKLAAATHLLATVNTYPVPNGNPSFPVSITHFSLLTDQLNNL